jgi:hypothetical protein
VTDHHPRFLAMKFCIVWGSLFTLFIQSTIFASTSHVPVSSLHHMVHWWLLQQQRLLLATFTFMVVRMKTWKERIWALVKKNWQFIDAWWVQCGRSIQGHSRTIITCSDQTSCYYYTGHGTTVFRQLRI